ncbi:hypothetical protein HDU81_000451 [Chytriomyces hyalinus]|nr:hypothetical protein HDU81_000451 [Chytriomyces hyalinus]
MQIAPPSEAVAGGDVSSISSAGPQEITPTSFAAIPSPSLDTAFPPVANDINGLCGGSSVFKNPLACKPGLVCAKQVGAAADSLGTCQVPNVSDIGGSCGGDGFNPATCAVGLACTPDALNSGGPGTCQIAIPTPTSAGVGSGGVVGTEEVIAPGGTEPVGTPSESVAGGGIVGTEPASTPSETVAGGGIVGTELVQPTTASTSAPSSAAASSQTSTSIASSSITSTVFGENFPPALTSFTTTSEESAPPSPSNGAASVLPIGTELAPPSPSNGAASVLPTFGTEPVAPSVGPAGTESFSETPSPAGPSTPTEVPASSTTTAEVPPTPSNGAAGTEPVPEPSSSSTTTSSQEAPPPPFNGGAMTETLDEISVSPVIDAPPTTTTLSTVTFEVAPPTASVPAAGTEPISASAPPSPSAPAAGTELLTPFESSSVVTATSSESGTSTFAEVPPSLSVPAAGTEAVPPTESTATTSSESGTSTFVEVPPSPSVPAAGTELASPTESSSASTTSSESGPSTFFPFPPFLTFPGAQTESVPPTESSSGASTESSTSAESSSVAESATPSESTSETTTVAVAETETITQASTTAAESSSSEATTTAAETTSESAIFIPEGPSAESTTSAETTTTAEEVPSLPSNGAGGVVSTTTALGTSETQVASSLSENVSTSTTSVESSATTAAGPRVLTLPEAYALVTRELASLPSCLNGCLNPDHSTSVTDDTANDLCVDAFGNDPFALVMCIVSDCTGNDFDTVINALTDPSITDGLSNACNVIYASLPAPTLSEIASAESAAATSASPLPPIFSSSTLSSMFASSPVKNGVNGTCGGYASDAATCLPGLKCVSKNPNEVGTCQKPIVNDVGQTCGGSISNNPASCAGALACMPNFIPGLPGTCQMAVEATSALSSSLSVAGPTATKKHKKYRMVIKTVECTTTTTTSTQYVSPSSSP